MAASLNEEEMHVQSMTEAADVYSFALVCYQVWSYLNWPHYLGGLTLNFSQIFTGSFPYSHIHSDASVILSVVAGVRPKRVHCQSVNDELWVLLENCWDAEPNHRPSMNTISHFFEGQATSIIARRARL
jgi:hypothetical protein